MANRQMLAAALTIWWEPGRPSVTQMCTRDPRVANDQDGRPGLWISVKRNNPILWNRLAVPWPMRVSQGRRWCPEHMPSACHRCGRQRWHAADGKNTIKPTGPPPVAGCAGTARGRPSLSSRRFPSVSSPSRPGRRRACATATADIASRATIKLSPTVTECAGPA